MQKQPMAGVLTGLAIAAVLAGTASTTTLARQESGQPEAAQQAAESPAPAEKKAPPAESRRTQPPRTGRFVGDHWTPYDPPAAESFPEGSQVHIIVPGDTLWDLSAKYLQDPFLWPQIWDVNQYIKDSHWIYPGDPVLIPGKPTVIGEGGPPPAPIELVEPPVPGAPPGAPSVAEPSAPTGLVPAGPALEAAADETDVYCSSYIVDKFEAPSLYIREREDGSRTILGTGDIVFLSQGLSSNLSPGDEFQIVTKEGVVPHPIFVENVGESVRLVGRAKVIALQERSATAQITQSCSEIELGMHLVPYEEIAVPLATPVEHRRYGVQFDPGSSGYIVDSSPDKAALGSGDIVNVDLGADNGLQPGDVLTIFREWGGNVEFSSTESYIEGEQARAERHRAGITLDPANFAQAILGQMVVLKTQKHTATAKIIISDKDIALGDRVGRP